MSWNTSSSEELGSYFVRLPTLVTPDSIGNFPVKSDRKVL